ncbi:MAG TPA: hypothetical protein PKI46_07065, partial [Bacteroidales bacterium]|nr:hypothetical protein [Bacteroidales bacterium]
EVKKFCIENKYSISELNEILNYQPSISLNKLEEIERKRFFNTDYALSHCISVTSGYNEKSEFCKMCKFSIECRKLL